MKGSTEMMGLGAALLVVSFLLTWWPVDDNKGECIVIDSVTYCKQEQCKDEV